MNFSKFSTQNKYYRILCMQKNCRLPLILFNLRISHFAALNIIIFSRWLIIQEQSSSATKCLSCCSHHEDTRQSCFQGQLSLNGSQCGGANLLPHSDTTIQQGHL